MGAGLLVMNSYAEFLESKTQLGGEFGFKPTFMPDFLFPFQRSLIEWAVRKGRAAIFADCGLGKTAMQLVWAQNVVEKENKPVLILTPLAVAGQTVHEAGKFGIEAARSRDGSVQSEITVTNYQQLHKFNPDDFAGCVCDESSILKSFDGAIKSEVTEFMRKMKFRLLCTATAAPNDYIELGTSSEAIGDLGFIDMISKFFKKSEATTSRSDEFRSNIYRFRGHAEKHFWRWVCSWARACRKPSDLGFPDDGFILPQLTTREHVIRASAPREDMLFDLPAIGLKEQRAERRRTLKERCEMAAELVADTRQPALMWCHLNDEGHMLESMLDDAVEVEGNDSDEFKEESFEAFVRGEIRVLISKPVIGGFGLNFQHCAHQTFFPSHSFEQWYQAIRRSWRFGQKRPVVIDMVTSEGEAGVLANLNRKAEAAAQMFKELVALMADELKIQTVNKHNKKQEIPIWI